jgi:hypothetical protein
LITFLISSCIEIRDWECIPVEEIQATHHFNIFDSPDELRRRHIADLDNYPLLDDHGIELPIFSDDGDRIPRRKPILNVDKDQCGVLMNFERIQALFNPDGQLHFDPDDEDGDSAGSIPPESHFVNVDVYPLAFLKTAGNLQANGIPHCFYPAIAQVNEVVRKDPNGMDTSSASESDNDSMDIDPRRSPPLGQAQVVKPISCQFYNYITHSMATRAGRHDSQQGSVTAALAGAFAQTPRDKKKAAEKQKYCTQALPSQRVHQKIMRDDCPISCRAEFVYSVDIRGLKDQTGRYTSIFLSL